MRGGCWLRAVGADDLLTVQIVGEAPILALLLGLARGRRCVGALALRRVPVVPCVVVVEHHCPIFGVVVDCTRRLLPVLGGLFLASPTH